MVYSKSNAEKVVVAYNVNALDLECCDCGLVHRIEIEVKKQVKHRGGIRVADSHPDDD